MHADVLLLGGDYRGKKGGNLDTLFTALSRVYTPYGTFAVMGNHDYGYCYSEVVEAMQKNHVRLMAKAIMPKWFIMLKEIRIAL